MTNRYYTDEDQTNLIYFQFPKLLMYAERYKKMSGDAKLLYMVCADLIKLSMKNPKIWKDPEKGYFIKLSNQSIQEKINCKNEKATKLLKELEKFDLLENVRMGQGKANRLFVKKLEYTEDDIYRANKEHEEMANDELSTGSEPSMTKNPEKPESRIPKNRKLESGKTGDKNPEKPELLRTTLLENDITNNEYMNNQNLNQDSDNNLYSEPPMNVDKSKDGSGLGSNSNPNILKISEQNQNWMSLLLTEINLPHRVKAILKNHVVQNHGKQMREDFNLFDVEEVYWLGIKEKLIDPEGMPQSIDSMNDTEFAYMLCKYIDKAEKAKFNFKSHLYKWMTGQLKKRDEWDFENFRNSMIEKSLIY